MRDAWHRGNVVQCGYCQPGQTLAAVSLLESDPSPDDAKIDEWMSGNLCRCGTYPRIRAAIHEAAGTLVSGPEPAPLTAPPEPEVGRLTPEEMADPVHPYIRIRDDGTIVAYSGQIEMGQGIHTGLATIVAEELDADFDSVRVVNASNGTGPMGDVYGNPVFGGAFRSQAIPIRCRGSGAAISWRPLRLERGWRPPPRKRGTCPSPRLRSTMASSATPAAGMRPSPSWQREPSSYRFRTACSQRIRPTTS